MSRDNYQQASVKIKNENTEQILGSIEQEGKNTAPGIPFALPCLVTLLFTLMAVSGLILKAAFTDPVQSLKDD